MAAVLDDIGVLDQEPGTERDKAACDGALRRLTALAERAPETFSTVVIELALALVADVHRSELLTPLRHVCRGCGAGSPGRVEAQSCGGKRPLCGRLFDFARCRPARRGGDPGVGVSG